MMDRATQAIVERLKLKFGPTWKVDHFPNVPERYPFAAAVKELLVGYEQSKYGSAASMGPLSAARDAEFSITLLVRSLRGPDGVAETIDKVRGALFGWRPTLPDGEGVQVPLGLGAMVPTEDSLVGEEQGVWRFVVSFTSSTIVVAETEDLTGPPLSRATSKDA